MEKNSLISVITPTYKSKEFIKKTIDSVLAQTYDMWELIIVDDASDDGIYEFIKNNYSDSRIKVYTREVNEGAARTRNYAIKKSMGRYLAFLDSDDTWHEDKLNEQLSFMKNRDLAFSFTAYNIIDSKNNKTVITVPKEIDYEGFLKNTIIGTSTVMLDCTKINNCFLVDVRQDHDSMTWLRIMRENRLVAHGLNKSLTNYYKREGSISNNKIKAAKVHWNNLRTIENLSLYKTIYVFIHYSVRAFIKHYIQ